MNKNKYAKIEDYKPAALMVIAAAREVQDGEVVFAGTGLPMIAIMAAQHTHAPNAVLIYEAGTIDSHCISLPSSVADPRCVCQASMAGGIKNVFDMDQRGWVDLGFLGGAEIDMYGNVNATSLGDYRRPTKRFPGSGGNVDINSLSRRSVYIMVQEKRRFRENVDYITSPGWRVKTWENGTQRWIRRQDLYKKNFRGGPEAVITDMAVFRFDKQTGLMYLDTVHPGHTVDHVKENVGFGIDVSRFSGETLPPTYHELDLLYKTVDPEGIFLQ